MTFLSVFIRGRLQSLRRSTQIIFFCHFLSFLWSKSFSGHWSDMLDVSHNLLVKSASIAVCRILFLPVRQLFHLSQVGKLFLWYFDFSFELPAVLLKLRTLKKKTGGWKGTYYEPACTRTEAAKWNSAIIIFYYLHLCFPKLRHVKISSMKKADWLHNS